MLRDAFMPMVVLSTMFHVGLFAWASRANDSPPRLLAPERGRFSIQLRAVEAATVEPILIEPPPEELEPLTETEIEPEVPLVLAEATPPELSELPEQLATPEPLHRAELPKPIEPPKPPTPRVVPPEVKRASAESRPSPASRASEGAEVDELPQLFSNPIPQYPMEALAAGVEGRVIVRVRVAADGSVVSASLLRSSGSTALDEAALEAVRRWRFVPARRGGVAVAEDVAVPVRFDIRNL